MAKSMSKVGMAVGVEALKSATDAVTELTAAIQDMLATLRHIEELLNEQTDLIDEQTGELTTTTKLLKKLPAKDDRDSKGGKPNT